MAMSLSDSEALLKKAIGDLDKRWLATAEHWNDQARAGFEKEHLEDLRLAAVNASRAMREIDQLLRDAIRQCS